MESYRYLFILLDTLDIYGENMAKKEYTFPAKVQKIGRIAIPKSVRDGLGIQEGDEITVTVEKEVK